MPDSPAVGFIHKGNSPLVTMEQWRLACFDGKNKRRHWKDDRSAKETARAWLAAAPGLQPDIAQVLATCRDIGPLRRWHAEPEAHVPIDCFRGPPNIDLLVEAEDDKSYVVIAIEAKVNERFGSETLNERYQNAHAERVNKPESRAVDRINALLDRFALDLDRPNVQELRYQLLTATAAALAQAKRGGSGRAVLIVHEFQTRVTRPECRKRNAEDLDHFLATALDHESHLAAGEITGPIVVRDAPALYVAKARTVVATN